MKGRKFNTCIESLICFLPFHSLISHLGVYFEETFINTKAYPHRYSSERLTLIVKNQSHSNCSTEGKFGVLPKGSRKTFPLAGQGSGWQEIALSPQVLEPHRPVGRGPCRLEGRVTLVHFKPCILITTQINLEGLILKVLPQAWNQFLEPHYCQLSSPWACAEGLRGGEKYLREEGKVHMMGKPKGKWGQKFN